MTVDKLFKPDNDVISSVLQKKKKDIIAKAGEILKNEWEKIKVDTDLVFRNYLKNSYDKYSKIKTILCLSEPQYIYKIFESPNLKRNWNEYIDSSDIDNILDLSHFFIIKGNGGIGKSTLMKHLFINELGHKDLIPIFIELQDVNDIATEYDIRDFVFNKLDNLGSTLKKEYLEYALESGCFLFLFDGYDEISSEKKNSFIKKIIDFSDKYSENFFIISSRPESDFIEFQRFTVLELCDFTKKQAVSLVSKIDFDTEIKEKFIKALYESLYDKHSSFASNPLLLNVMLLTYENYAEIPEKVHLFYAQAFDTLIQKHDATKGGFQRNFKTSLTSDDLKKIISKFCFITYYQKKLKFTHDELVNHLKEAKIKKIDFSYDDIIDDMRDALCFIYTEGIYYYFTHRSFQEYFTAVFLKDLPDENMEKLGLKLIEKDSWRAANDDTFSMLYDMSTERFEQNILLKILESFEKKDLQDKYDFYFHNIKPDIKFVNGNQSKLMLQLLTKVTDVYNDNICDIIFNFTYKYKQCSSKIDNKNENKLYEYLKKQKNYINGHRINYEDIINDKQLYELLKETWIGKRIKTMANLKDILKTKKRENDLDLEGLLNIE
ncbi:NACHT domain-containing NTPase [Ruminococcus flavefaciens]|uniref:NACHT domain-containing protein n=1 Tax=Ruminococcus flavefaciens TaxID=1265 RepID=UPI0026EF436D|nr:NACHT domain-containing protein [Ruminococcus flavefaciens]